ncbi:hypothetical protein JTB14_021487 [Gonioctena quinquepunctata]|nr:hypothetical protein JTB14_021487 [Gonioctena quinquepunctata]
MKVTLQRNVNLAVQILSGSAADSLEFLVVDLQDIRFREAGATIKCIRLMNKVFDLLNSRNPMTIYSSILTSEFSYYKWRYI